ncbi:MAG: YdeI/OmpD-associated family protein, partial [Maribacter dokdonensis]
VEIEKSNLIIPTNKVSDYEVPEELKIIFKENPTFKNAFEKLTPGRQKGYLLHFSKAKQSSTRLARINKYTNRILSGKGLNDCICGLSKRMPNCDGSHKGTGTIS